MSPIYYPDFSDIAPETLLEKIKNGIEQQRIAIQTIKEVDIHNLTFENTVLALERSQDFVGLPSRLFFNLLSAASDEALMEISATISDMLTDLSNEITYDTDLANRVRLVYEQQDGLGEQEKRLTYRTYQGFEDAGAYLKEEEREELKQLKKERAAASLQFGLNILKEMNAFVLHLTQEEQVQGIPESVRAVALAKAEQEGKKGWVFDLSMPSYLGVMKYCDRRDIREHLYRAKATLCANTEKETQNVDLVHKIVAIRKRIAEIMGYTSYAEYALKDRMLSSTKAVYNVLEELRDSYMPLAKQEVAEVTEFAHQNGFPQENTLEMWDWAYYAEKYRAEKLDFNQETTRPYFELKAVQNAMFNLAGRLFDLSFSENKTLKPYHPEVTIFEVCRNKEPIGILILDYFPRKGKQPGAWMTEYVEASQEHQPVVSLVMNFSPATKKMPSLLTFDECTTMFHEFGHALHGLLTKGKYASLNGTNVVRDFVELPSQLMENWMRQREFLITFAKHYETREPIPEDILNAIAKNNSFLEGYNCIRQLGFAYLDMAWHTLQDPKTDIRKVEVEVSKPLKLLESAEEVGLISTAFSHIFDGGYATGYYGYKWAEVLEADAFEEFKKHGIFNKNIADRYREYILEKGDQQDAMTLYIAFKGTLPTTAALKRRSGCAKI